VNRKLKLILLFSVILRVAAALYLGNTVTSLPGTADQVSYHTLALRVLDGHGFTFDKAWWPVTAAGSPTAHWSYLYTFYLIIVYAIFGPVPLAARLIQAVAVGVLQPYLAYRLVEEIGGFAQADAKRGRVQEIGLIAAGITAVYLYFVYYAAALMTEPFYLTAILASFVLALLLAKRIAERPSLKLAAGLGVTLAVTVLLRQLFLLLIPFLFLWLLAVTYKQGLWPRTIAALGVTTAVIIAAIIPITLFNYTQFDRFVLLNTNAGYAFFWGNHPVYGNRFIAASEMDDIYQQLIPAELRQLDEAALDQALLKQGIQFVVDDPVRYIRLSLSRIPAYFKFWPDAASGRLSNLSRLGSFALFLPFMLYGLVRPFITFHRSSGTVGWTRPSASLVLLYLFILIYTGIHVLTWTQVRYRLPVDAVLIVFAALAVAELGETISRRIRHRTAVQQL
jgi:4-amino-4-deoxy-L-arabinose transferase-like glycosyltransferase